MGPRHDPRDRFQYPEHRARWHRARSEAARQRSDASRSGGCGWVRRRPPPAATHGRESVMSGNWIGILGLVAGCCTAGSFVPQVLKAWREGDTGAISKRMYTLTV